eukprot:SAG31_NODE_4398_length_3239_cov_6.414380_3_plen_81_part_00
MPALGAEPYNGIFIRAPAVLEVGEGVQPLCSIDPPAGGDAVVVACRQGHLLGCAFHPELTQDLRWHSYFVQMVAEDKATR